MKLARHDGGRTQRDRGKKEPRAIPASGCNGCVYPVKFIVPVDIIFEKEFMGSIA